MKKLLALVLSVIMAASLAVPVFADGPAPKEAVFPISTDELSSLGIIGGADGPTAIITTTAEDLLPLDPNELKESLGGLPGQLGVMVNGAYIRFPDAAPEASNGRIMVPIRAVVESLGGEADYRDGAAWLAVNGREYEFVIGSPTVTVREGGTPVDTIEMDCVPYAKDNRTYVPIRFICEALGYEANWDGTYQTAVLLDREALAADIDKNLTILSRVQAAANPALKEGESWSVEMEGGLSAAVLGMSYKADLTGKVLLNSEALNGSCSVTLSDNAVDTLLAAVLSSGGSLEDAALVRSIITNLKDMEVIMDREGMMWVHAPGLDGLSGTENLWSAVDMSAEMGMLMFAETGTATMGSVLTAMLSGESVEEMAAVCETAELMDRLYGDDKFTTDGGVSTLTIGVDELMALYEDMGLDLDEVEGVWKEYNVTMKVDSEGGTAVTVVMETNAQLDIPAVRVTVDSARNAQGSSMTMKVNAAGLVEVELTLNASQQATSEVPRTEPPEGAVIVEPAASATNEQVVEP